MIPGYRNQTGTKATEGSGRHESGRGSTSTSRPLEMPGGRNVLALALVANCHVEA